MQLLLVISVLCTLLQAKNIDYNNRPIIGILAQATGSKYGDTYIPANYVKYLEQAGARVVPIRVREKPAYYEKLCKHINGSSDPEITKRFFKLKITNWATASEVSRVAEDRTWDQFCGTCKAYRHVTAETRGMNVLFPGGAVGIISSDYAKAARIIYDLAIKANDAGDHFPLWGTCQGFELLTNLTARKNLLKRTDCMDISLPLKFAPGFKSSQMFQRLSANILHILSSEPVTPNFHNYGVLIETFNQTKSLNTFYRLLSTNTDRKGKEFISTIEAYKYPFYGTQWHPEKINFDWNPTHKLDHGSNGVLVSHYFSSFFVSSARRSKHAFPKPEDEAHAVIQNCLMVYEEDGSFEQVYYLNYTTNYDAEPRPVMHVI